MKRRRKSAFPETQMQNSDKQIKMSGASKTDLPLAIIFDIVLKLPTKSIAMCKCVCKSWRSLISDPHFAELHLAQAETFTLVRDTHNSRVSRVLYLLEPEDICRPDSGYCLCRPNKTSCVHCLSNTTVATKMKIPLSTSQAIGSASSQFNEFGLWSNHRYDVANSCNGLLCLSKGSERAARVVVCNPVLGEFIRIPEDGHSHVDDFMRSFDFGLGFSPKHNQYKVIMTVEQRRMNFSYHVAAAQIHTLGTDSWRSLDVSEVELGSLDSPSYLDGSLYWIFRVENGDRKVASFDLDEERFQVHSFPSPIRIPEMAIRVVGGRLYLYTKLARTRVDIWVVNGFSESWNKLFSIDVSELNGSNEYHQYQLLFVLNNDAVVMFSSYWNEFIYYDRLEGLRVKTLNFFGLISKFKAISHTLSFISLKDVVKQGNAEVLNIDSWNGNLKLEEETYPLLLGGARK